MNIRHHPDESLLLAYAVGASDEATGLIIATHMVFCAQCRRSVALMEKIGGGLLDLGQIDRPAGADGVRRAHARSVAAV